MCFTMTECLNIEALGSHREVSWVRYPNVLCIVDVCISLLSPDSVCKGTNPSLFLAFFTSLRNLVPFRYRIMYMSLHIFKLVVVGFH